MEPRAIRAAKSRMKQAWEQPGAIMARVQVAQRYGLNAQLLGDCRGNVEDSATTLASTVVDDG